MSLKKKVINPKCSPMLPQKRGRRKLSKRVKMMMVLLVSNSFFVNKPQVLERSIAFGRFLTLGGYIYPCKGANLQN